MREQVERGAAEHRDRRHELQRVVDVPERLLEPEREQHDAGDHREVQVGEGVARDLVALAARRRASRGAARRRARRRRSTATTARRRRRRPRTAADDDAGVDAELGADADRDDRLAERDDDDQPVALGEVRRARASSPRRRRSSGPPMSSSSASAHSAPCTHAVGERRRRRAAPTPIAVLTASPITDGAAPGRRGWPA